MAEAMPASGTGENAFVKWWHSNGNATTEDVEGLCQRSWDAGHSKGRGTAAAALACINELLTALDSIKWHRAPGGNPTEYQCEIEDMASAAIAKATGVPQ